MSDTISHTIEWRLRSFSALSPHELYALLRLRSEVFVVEQACIFLDMDNMDQDCWHLMGWQGTALLAATRLVPPGVAYEYASIGRVVTAPAARGTGLGRELMLESIKYTEELFGRQPIRIGAQRYLKAFYESFGFAQSGEMYLEDGIPHIEMTRPVPIV